MQIDVIRYSSSSESTLGLLMIDGQFECYTLEDEYRAEKVMSETRIPAGKYRLSLRTYGGHHTRYLAKYGSEFHYGMLQVMEVPGFTDILIHKGNTDDDTAGCLLVGDGANNNQTKDGFISSSGLAYQRLYPRVASVLLAGQDVWINYHDQVNLSQDNAPVTTRQQTVDTARLYLREVPMGLQKAVLMQGASLSPLKTDQGWTKVHIEGWVSSKYLK